MSQLQPGPGPRRCKFLPNESHPPLTAPDTHGTAANTTSRAKDWMAIFGSVSGEKGWKEVAVFQRNLAIIIHTC
jgi:uncharacterized heparinase superfamily protein